MQLAIDEARLSRSQQGIPIGAVLVRDGQVLARGHNQLVQKNEPILHGEMDCLHNAGRIGNYRGTTLYTTLMPCYMCAGAVVFFGIKRVIAGEAQTVAHAADFMREHGVEVVDLQLVDCQAMMAEFIQTYPTVWQEDSATA